MKAKKPKNLKNFYKTKRPLSSGWGLTFPLPPGSLMVDHQSAIICCLLPRMNQFDALNVCTKPWTESEPPAWPTAGWPMLRSAVGKTHDLRSDLWWTIPLHILLDSFGIPFGFHTIKSALARHSGVQVPVISRHILPSGLHGLCFGFCFAGPPLYVPCHMVHFQGSISGSP